MSTPSSLRADAFAPVQYQAAPGRARSRRRRQAGRKLGVSWAALSWARFPSVEPGASWTGFLDLASGGPLGRRALLVGFFMGALLGTATPVLSATPSDAAPSAANATIAMLPTASLKPDATVEGAQIRLGDLFSDCGAHAADIVGDAPPPGGSLTLDISWLASTATEHGLSWQPPNQDANITVRRAATTIDGTQIGQQLLEKIAGGRPDREVQLDSDTRLYVPVGAATDIAVDNLDYDEAGGRFSADLRVPADDPTAPSVRVTGRVIAIVDVPVLARPMMPGEPIGAGDVSWMKVPAQELPAGDVTDIRGLVGYMPRHPLRAGMPLRMADVEQPLLVHRNDLVLIVLQQPGLYITAEGKAMDDGAGGAVVPVMNLQSKRIIQTVVVGADQVGLAMPPNMGGELVAAAGNGE